MGYRKFKADRLFDGYRFHDGDQVLVVKEDGEVEGILGSADAGEGIEEVAGILSPGLINCHCHLELSHLKGQIPEGTGLVSFVGQVMSQRSAPEEEILAAIEAAEAEMTGNGIVAVGDICNTAYTIKRKSASGMRYYNFIEVSGFDPAGAGQRFGNAMELVSRFGSIRVNGQPIPCSIVPHSPYSVSKELWELIIREGAGKIMSIHNQEDPAENDFFINKEGAFLGLYEKLKLDLSFFSATGQSSLRTCLQRFPAGQPVILVHNVFTTAGDLAFIDQLNHSPSLSWCLCPQANRYINGVLPDIPLLMKGGRTMVLGTDSLASNHQLDLMSEIGLIRRFYPEISDAEMLTWATSNGARVLQMDDKLGSFEKGKKPGITVIAPDLGKARKLI
ncbi:MAG: amidohydrolase family protein [Chitinophagaceae bacterium]